VTNVEDTSCAIRPFFEADGSCKMLGRWQSLESAVSQRYPLRLLSGYDQISSFSIYYEKALISKGSHKLEQLPPNPIPLIIPPVPTLLQGPLLQPLQQPSLFPKQIYQLLRKLLRALKSLSIDILLD
jgi:hypothetical protein